MRACADQRRADDQEDHHRRRQDGTRCRQPRMAAKELPDLLHPAQLRGIFQRAIFQEAAQVIGQMVALLITPRGIGVQAFAHDALQAPGNIPPDLPQGRGVPAPLDDHRLDLGGAGRVAPALFEQVSAGHHLGEDQSE